MRTTAVALPLPGWLGLLACGPELLPEAWDDFWERLQER